MSEVYSQWTTSDDDQWRSETLSQTDYQWQPPAIEHEIIKQWVSYSIVYSFDSEKEVYSFFSDEQIYTYEALKKIYDFYAKTYRRLI